MAQLVTIGEVEIPLERIGLDGKSYKTERTSPGTIVPGEDCGLHIDTVRSIREDLETTSKIEVVTRFLRKDGTYYNKPIEQPKEPKSESKGPVKLYKGDMSKVLPQLEQNLTWLSLILPTVSRLRIGLDGRSYKTERTATGTIVPVAEIEEIDPFDEWFDEHIICGDALEIMPTVERKFDNSPLRVWGEPFAGRGHSVGAKVLSMKVVRFLV